MSLISKDGMEALYLQKQEAMAKRERMKQYSFSHRVGYADFSKLNKHHMINQTNLFSGEEK